MIFNPLDKFYKSIIGAVPAQNEITFRVKGEFDSVVFVLRKDGQECLSRFEMQKFDDYFYSTIKIDSGLYFYYFELNNGQFITNDNLNGVISKQISEFQLTAYDNDYAVPDWIYGGVIYQIFPDIQYAVFPIAFIVIISCIIERIITNTRHTVGNYDFR